MTLFFQATLVVHIAAGVVALCTFWLPLVTRKGGRTHRRVGWVYVTAAATIAVTAFVLCGRLLSAPSPGRVDAGVFLAYVSLLAAASAQLAVRALRTKQRTAASHDLVDLVPPLLLVAGGIALAAFGVHRARRLGMHTFDLPLWVVPIVVLAIGLTLWRRHYARRLSTGWAP